MMMYLIEISKYYDDDVVADRKVKVLKMLLIEKVKVLKMLLKMLLIKMSKC